MIRLVLLLVLWVAHTECSGGHGRAALKELVHGEEPVEHVVEELMEDFDTNQDGELSEDEVEKMYIELEIRGGSEHANEEHEHADDEHGHEDEHSEDEHGHEDDEHGHEDEHGEDEHSEDEHGHEDDEHGHEDDEHGHEDEHSEDEHGHEDDEHGHEDEHHEAGGDEGCIPVNVLVHRFDKDENDKLNTTELRTAVWPLALMVSLPGCQETKSTSHDDHGHGDHGHDEHGHDEHGHDDHGHKDHTECEQSAKHWKWIAALGCVVFLSFLTLVGLSLLFVRKHILGVLPLLVAFAVGTLLGDTFLHLIPAMLPPVKGNDHSHGGEVTMKPWVPLLVAVMAYLIFFLLESLLRQTFGHDHHHHHNVQPGTRASPPPTIPGQVSSSSAQPPPRTPTLKFVQAAPAPPPPTPPADAPERCDSVVSLVQGDVPPSPSESASTPPHSPKNNPLSGASVAPGDTTMTAINIPDAPKASQPLALMAIFGDGLHNFVDGIAIGVTFSASLSTGAATFIAIIVHEIPQEVSDFAIMLSAGYSWKKAALLNFLSGLSAVLGCIIGLAAGDVSGNVNSILTAIIVGGFVYIACTGLVPLLHQMKEHNNGYKGVVVDAVLALIGVIIMLVLGFLEPEGDCDAH